MGTLLAVPAVALGIALTGVIIISLFPLAGLLVLGMLKALLRVIPGIRNLVPADPPTEEELEVLRKQEEKRRLAREAEIEKEIREAKRPKTLDVAQAIVDSAKEAVNVAETAVDAALADAKSKGFGFQVVAETRDALSKSEWLLKEAEADRDRLSLKQIGEAGGAKQTVPEGANAVKSAPTEFATSNDSDGATKRVSARDSSCMDMTVGIQQPRSCAPSEFQSLSPWQSASTPLSRRGGSPLIYVPVLPPQALIFRPRLRVPAAVKHNLSKHLVNAIRRI